MRISDYLKIDCIKIPLNSMKKNDIIKELLILISEVYKEIDVEDAFKSVIKREKIETTAIGNGIAIPHARKKNITKVYFAFGITKKGVDFNAIDEKPVNLVFLILCPEKKVNTQISLLARLSRILHDKKLRKNLFTCKTNQSIIDVFTQYEKKHFS